MPPKSTSLTAKQKASLQLAAEAEKEWGAGAELVVGDGRWAVPEATARALVKKGLLAEPSDGRLSLTEAGRASVTGE